MIEQRSARLELNEQINIAFWRGIASSNRPEDTHVSCTVLRRQLQYALAVKMEYVVDAHEFILQPSPLPAQLSYPRATRHGRLTFL